MATEITAFEEDYLYLGPENAISEAQCRKVITPQLETFTLGKRRGQNDRASRYALLQARRIVGPTGFDRASNDVGPDLIQFRRQTSGNRASSDRRNTNAVIR